MLKSLARKGGAFIGGQWFCPKSQVVCPKTRMGSRFIGQSRLALLLPSFQLSEVGPTPELTGAHEAFFLIKADSYEIHLIMGLG